MFEIKKSTSVYIIVLLASFVQGDDLLNTTLNRVNKKFYIGVNEANFFQAFVDCKQGGLELASIKNEYESAALDTFLDPYKKDGWNNGFWLSGTNLVDESNFQYYWLNTGERTIFRNWLPNQPDNSNSAEHCMQWAYFENKIGWNDNPCSAVLRYVCESIDD